MVYGLISHIIWFISLTAFTIPCNYLAYHLFNDLSSVTLLFIFLMITLLFLFLLRWEYQATLLPSWETYMQYKKQQLELDMEQRTGSKLGKEYVKAVYCHPDYLTYM